MSEPQPQQAPSKKTMSMIIGIITASFLFAFVSIPLYRLVCERLDPGGSAWQNGETEAYTDVRVDRARSVRVSFATNVNRQLPWAFEIDNASIALHPGEQKRVLFKARNLDNVPTRGKAVYDINPPEAGPYFKKVECFCFDDQPLKAGESADLPLVFWFEPDLPAHIKHITIGYTFFNFDSSYTRSAERAEVSR